MLKQSVLIAYSESEFAGKKMLCDVVLFIYVSYFIRESEVPILGHAADPGYCFDVKSENSHSL